MTNRPHPSFVSLLQSQAELELLHLIAEQPVESAISYPYNPADAESDAYFEALEQEVLAAGWSTEDLNQQGQKLSQSIDQLWASLEPPVAAVAPAASLQSELSQRFADRVPQRVLEAIVQKARQVFAQNLSLSEQLVQCVQDCLPQWEVEDLQVFARPLAYAMRAPETEALESSLRSVRMTEWAELSEVEQVRLSMAIARYTIAQLASSAHETSETDSSN